MSVTDIVGTNKSWEVARCLEYKTVIEHFYLYLGSLYVVRSMADAINHHLLYSEFWIVAVGNKTSVLAQEGVFANLSLKIVNSATNLVKDGSLKSHVLDDVHFCTDFLFRSFVAYEACTSTREESLWIFAKEKNARCAYLLLTIDLSNEIIILSQVLHGRLDVTNDLDVVIHKVHVNIVDGGAINILVFVVAFTLVIEELHALVKVEFLALITNTHEALVCLIGV